MKRLITPIAAALLGLGCAEETPVAHPGPLMASAPAAITAAKTPMASASPRAPAPAPMAPAPAPMAPAPAPMAPAPTPMAPAPAPIAPDAAAHAAHDTHHTDHTDHTHPTGTTGGSRASAPTDTACQPGRLAPPADAPWSGGPDWRGTGHPDPAPLQKIPDADMLALAADLTRADPDRQHALVSIGRRHLRGALDVYRQSLEASQPKPIREMTLTGLIEHGGPDALPLMKRLLDDPSDHLRGMAIWAVALYGESEAHAAILRGLEDPEASVQGMAVLAVWALRDRPELALPILEATALTEDRRVWQEAFNVLGRMPSSDAGNLLARHARAAKGEKAEAARWHARQWRNRYPELCR